MDISVIIPLFNEEESLPELYAWIERVMNDNGFTFEVIFVNDGSTEHPCQEWSVEPSLPKMTSNVHPLSFITRSLHAQRSWSNST